MADEPVVVKKLRPMKAGNRLEDKIEETLRKVVMGYEEAKSTYTCEGAKFIRRILEISD